MPYVNGVFRNDYAGAQRGLGKKGPLCASTEFDALIGSYSKAALVDALWCACQLGADTHEEITTRGAREMRIALRMRGDRVRPELVAIAERHRDGD
jgi:hypothetical protein|tara:strand:- start:1451 stop:1738 length:288 start_codon:yes stop_codon:yes gene_type:complete